MGTTSEKGATRLWHETRHEFAVLMEKKTMLLSLSSNQRLTLLQPDQRMWTASDNLNHQPLKQAWKVEGYHPYYVQWLWM